MLDLQHSTYHWWAQRVTAIVITILSFFVFPGFIEVLISHGPFSYSKISYIFISLFLIASLYHGALGMRVIFEDYIHCIPLRVFCCVLSDLLALVTGFAFMIACVF